jgi:hypothetical protein
MIRSIAILALVLLGVARSDGALNEPERRVRLGTCGADHCVWCQDQFDAFCPAVGATIVHDDQCNIDLSCDVAETCALTTGASFSGELVMMVDDAPCGAATGACDRGNGAVTKLAFCGKRADNSTFTIATTKMNCCRQAASPTGNVACGAVADGCFPRGNPFLCDQEHGNCTSDLASCCVSEDIIPDASWLGLQIFPPPMAAALRVAVPGGGLPVMTSASDLGRQDHQADGQPSVQRYAVEASFVTPPSDFSAVFPDCTVTQGIAPAPHATCDFCGDGEVDPGEECDDGASNGSAASCCDASCKTKPCGAAPVGGKLLLVKDNADATKRKVVFVSMDPAIDTTVGAGVDPVTNGASFQLYNANGSGESVCLPLPSASWESKGKPPTPSYSYKDPTAAAGPCKAVKVKHGKLLKVICIAKLKPIAYSLDEPTQGTMAVRFTSGSTTYCATFGGDKTVDSGTDPPNSHGKGRFKSKNATAVPCPSAPAPCP